MYQKTTLENGVRVLTGAMPHTRSAAILIYYKVGARYEPKELSGISHYIEHMLFKGTRKRPTPQQIAEEVEGLGGSLNAMTDREYTAYSALVPSRHFGTALDVLTDMLEHSRFAAAEVKRERSVIIEEINGTLDSPPDIAGENISELIWGDHPLGRPTAGTRETVAGITRAQLLAFLKDHYLPQVALVSVAGQVEHEQAVDAVRATLGRVRDTRLPPDYAPAVSDQTAPRIRVVEKDTEQTHLFIGLPALSYNDPARYVQQMLNAILGGVMSSRLFVEIREKRALAYAIESYSYSLADTGAIIVYAGVDNSRVESCIGAVMHELDRLRQQPVTEAELRKVQEYHKGHLLLALESSSAVAGWGGRQELLRDRIDTVDDVLAAIDAVTPAQVQALAGRLFQEERLSLSLVGPFKNEDRFLKLLLSF